MKRCLILITALLLIASSARAAVSYVNRSENNSGTSSAYGLPLTVNYPTGIAAGDVVVASIYTYQLIPAGGDYTSGGNVWTLACQNSNSTTDYQTIVYETYSTGYGSSMTFGNSGNLQYPYIVMRDYRGVGAIDASLCMNTSGGSTSLEISAFGAGTAVNNEWYVGFWGGQPSSTFTQPGGFGDLGLDTPSATAWSILDGDITIPTAGTIPAAQTTTASPSAGYWIAAAITLEPVVIPVASTLMQGPALMKGNALMQ